MPVFSGPNTRAGTYQASGAHRQGSRDARDPPARMAHGAELALHGDRRAPTHTCPGVEGGRPARRACGGQDGPVPLTTPYTLTPGRTRERSVRALTGRLPRVGLDGVLADLDHDAEPCDVPGEAAEIGRASCRASV